MRVALFLLLLAFWAGLSGIFDSAYLVASAFVTCSLVTLLAWRNDLLVTDWSPARLVKTIVVYVPWLLWQVLLANWRVLRVVWSPPGKMPIDPKLVDVPCELKTTTGRVLLANSITLTPGTVTIEVTPGRLLVHALTPPDAEGLFDGNMQGRIRRLEPATASEDAR